MLLFSLSPYDPKAKQNRPPPVQHANLASHEKSWGFCTVPLTLPVQGAPSPYILNLVTSSIQKALSCPAPSPKQAWGPVLPQRLMQALVHALPVRACQCYRREALGLRGAPPGFRAHALPPDPCRKGHGRQAGQGTRRQTKDTLHGLFA